MRKWKAPNRPSHEVSQVFNDGIVVISALEDKAQPGFRPSTEKVQVVTLRYQEQKLGIQRYYSGKQNQIQIERVIRVPKPPMKISNQNIAATEDGTLYRIDLIQNVEDVFPKCLDITLTRYEQGASN